MMACTIKHILLLKANYALFDTLLCNTLLATIVLKIKNKDEKITAYPQLCRGRLKLSEIR